jgi:NADPH-dependent glutamate synthase beta subunit-like oxidoreductase/nitroreductase/NAD-dependent dihydropyrimidine dehydrogenase PreA subunit
MSATFSKKYTVLSDPPVAKSPFTINLDEDKCIGCGLCIQQCPCQTLTLVERPYSDMQEAACQYKCPAGIDVRKYMSHLADGGDYREAWNIITEANPFPAITGMVCPHPCEGGCNRQYLDGAVNINEVERFIGTWGVKEGLAFQAPSKKTGKRVAVVGSGPSGMSCAYHLARLGHEVTVYESAARPGGMLRYAIPGYRLAPEVIDAEYKRVIDMGVLLRLGVTVGKDVSMGDLASQYNAVYAAIGAAKSKDQDFGASGRIFSGLEFLRKVNEGQEVSVGRRVLVIGGGNTAIDAARTARRLGAEVTILYRRSRNEMPAHDDEIRDALDEGVRIEYLAAPVSVTCAADGHSTVTCTRMRLCEEDESGRCRPEPVEGSGYEVQAESVIYAIGQDADLSGFDDLADGGWLAADGLGATKMPNVYAGGDAVTGPETVTAAIGAGRKVALAIDARLSGKTYSSNGKKEISFRDVPLYGYDKAEWTRANAPAPAERLAGLKVPTAGHLTTDDVSRESKRCFSCGSLKSDFTSVKYFGKVCIACHNCEAICPHEALDFPNYYRVEKGRWTTGLNIPDDGAGYPNPFMDENSPRFEEIDGKITDLERVIYRRRSNRVFKKDQVPKEMIHRILEAGRFAPSAGNGQPWKFLVVRDRALMDEISAACSKTLGLVTKIYQGKGPLRKLLKNSLAFLKPDSIDQRPMVAIQALVSPQFGDGGHMDVFFGAPTVIYVLVHHMGISTPILSTGMCCQNIALAAHSIGLGTCYSGFAGEPVNISKKLKKKLGITWPYDLVATAIAVGFPAVQIDKPVKREFPQVDWIE